MTKRCCRCSLFSCFSGDDRQSSSSSAPTQAELQLYKAPPSGDPSSSTSTVPELTKKIEHHVAVGAEKDSINVEGIIQDISELFKIIKTKSSDEKPSTGDYWPSSSSFSTLKEILSEGANAALATKDIISSSEGMKVVKHLLIGLGQAHWAVAGLLVVANILERFETVAANQDECLSLLEEMSKLAHHVKDLKERPGLKKGMESSIRNATEMIVEGALMCCTQIKSSKFSRFFSTSVDKEKLAKFQQKLQKMYRRMDNQTLICILDAIECANVRPPLKERERSNPAYAVGIEEQLEEVIELLEWESQKNAVAIMVHGFGGMGKTTLADAVFARLYIEGCKYSMVRLFEDINSTPNIIELQKCMLRDLMLGSREEEQRSVLENIRTFEDGQREIGRMLEKEVAFIYIDNVLAQYPLENLLPRDMEKAKRCRLLITTRDREMRKGCSMDNESVKFYDVKYLPDTVAMNLLKKEIHRELLSSDQLQQIVELCGGIPKLLNVLARYIRFEERGQAEAFNLLMEDKKKWNLKIEGLDGYLFTYERLPEIVKDPFLDICSFFNGYDWDEVRNIVGDSNIDVLEKRGLVNKDKNMKVTVHDVILKIGSQKSEGKRIIFKSADEIENFLQKKKKDLQGIKGISFNEINDIFLISARKLDSMSDSLRILALGSYGNVEGTCDKFFEKLVYFQGKVPYLQFDVSQSKELRCLKCQPQDLNFLKQMPPNLKHVELDGSLQSGDAFEISSSDRQQHHGLRTLRLFHFEGLKNLPGELGDLLKFLQELNLSYCASIEELPASMSKLQSLRKLMLFECTSLKSLPENLGSLSSLQTLDLKYCKSIVEVRGPVSNLQSLRELCMSDCSSLKRLPEDLGYLSSLQKLDLSFCQSIEELPRSFSRLQSLRELSLFNCSSLKRLPKQLGYLSSLQSLYLSGCVSIQVLPPSFSKLQSLRQFVLEDCSNLESLPDDFGCLSSLQELDLGFCSSIQELPRSISRLQSLRELKLAHCYDLMSLPEDLGRLSSLQTLDLSHCKALQELPESFSKLPSLKKLLMSGCVTLRRLPKDFISLAPLEVLEFEEVFLGPSFMQVLDEM